MAKQFVPYEKMSKRQRKEIDRLRRGEIIPAPRIIPDRHKEKETKKNLTFYKNYAIIIIEKINAAVAKQD